MGKHPNGHKPPPPRPHSNSGKKSSSSDGSNPCAFLVLGAVGTLAAAGVLQAFSTAMVWLTNA